MGHNAKAELYSFVDQLRNYLNISSYPINTTQICRAVSSIEVIEHRFKSPGICASAFVGNKNDTIILNSYRSETEQNHDCGHEIIHLTKHRNYSNNGMFSCFSKVKPSQNSFLEWEANEGSAELLVPYALLLPMIAEAKIFSNKGYLLGFQQFKMDMAQHFQVSDAVISFRLEGLKYEIWQYINGVALHEIQILSNTQQKKQNINIKSLNDIYKDQQKDKVACESEHMFLKTEKLEKERKQAELDAYNMMMVERVHNNWLDCDYDFHS